MKGTSLSLLPFPFLHLCMLGMMPEPAVATLQLWSGKKKRGQNAIILRKAKQKDERRWSSGIISKFLLPGLVCLWLHRCQYCLNPYWPVSAAWGWEHSDWFMQQVRTLPWWWSWACLPRVSLKSWNMVSFLPTLILNILFMLAVRKLPFSCIWLPFP